MFFPLTDILRFFHGGEKKKKSAFSSEKEAYDFCRNLYKKNGGATPELIRAYEFYQKNFEDGCEPYDGPETTQDNSARVKGQHSTV